MNDTVIKGSGNSRTLKTVPNAAALYPTYEAFIQAFAAGELPIDLGPLNPAGLNVRGTDLNKATLLKDSTAALYGLGADATPDQIFQILFKKVSTGTYWGSGTGIKSFTFEFEPVIFLVGEINRVVLPNVFFKGKKSYGVLTYPSYDYASVTVKWNGKEIEYSGKSEPACDVVGRQYAYVAMG